MVKEILFQIFHNYIFQTAFWGWFIAQFLKFIIEIIRQDTFNWERLVGSGGFPSSHTSLVISMTTSIGLHRGIDSDLFALSLVFSLIVMYDASGIRREAGRQAQILNKLMNNLATKDLSLANEGKLLKELVGHTPFEVFGGVMLGILVGFVMYYYF